MSSADPTPTLATSSSLSSPNPELFTPPPSHTSLQQVPDVFVTPPEEEHGENPPFCYFDAAMESKRSLCTVPDIDALDVALGFYQQNEGNPAPFFRRQHSSESVDTVVMPRRGGGREQDFPAPAGDGRRLFDEDVVEVVKVRKADGASNTPEAPRTYTLKKSRTFRARASQALRSIKNVGKSSSRPGGPESWAASSGRENAAAEGLTEDGGLPRPSTPNLARKKSIQLSQIFMPARSRAPTPDVPMSPTSPTSSVWSALTRPSLAIEDCTSPSYSVASEVPSMSKGRSFVRRISVLDLHKFFGPSTASPTATKAPPLPVPAAKENVRPSASLTSSKRGSMPISGSRNFSSIDDVFSAAATDSRGFYASRAQHSLPSFSALGVNETDDAAETNAELQLDSLHFDSFHLDFDDDMTPALPV
ncbi:hypothetical protein PHLGIDRAFT_180040 [Phlebiopsis gigantea 11061_1 CR5-6]|uniref:Uncharacterized protein n=1 Tax=Phlebiopsis gigantea (strain 11061_1 CR5-6) TaxID=745531 RepID=A0A0C3S7M3_PHLG1|nr:hypothetical protein PHLGIDRAFT_180040 [Phlebiopsis gigantea 11061_1 CR5-6]